MVQAAGSCLLTAQQPGRRRRSGGAGSGSRAVAAAAAGRRRRQRQGQLDLATHNVHARARVLSVVVDVAGPVPHEHPALGILLNAIQGGWG